MGHLVNRQMTNSVPRTCPSRWRCPHGERFDEAYLECRKKEDVLECQTHPDPDDDYPYELVPFKPF